MKIFITILIAFLFVPLYGQETYISVPVAGNGNNIYRVEADYSLTFIVTVNGYPLADIALSPNGVMYGIVISTSDYYYEIVEIDLIAGALQIIATLPAFNSFGYTSLVCSNDYELYTLSANGELYRYDILNDVIDIVAYVGDTTPGDLTFYKGNLIFQSNSSKDIKAFNIQNETLSTILCMSAPWPVQYGIEDNYGVTNNFENCETEQIVATDLSDGFYELDIENEQIFLLENFPIQSPASVYGLTSTTEHLASTCAVYSFDDIDCNAVGIEEQIDELINIYPNPAEDFIIIEGIENISYIKVFSSDGKNVRTINTDIDRIELGNYPSGIYFFQFFVDEKYFTKKILIR